MSDMEQALKKLSDLRGKAVLGGGRERIKKLKEKGYKASFLNAKVDIEHYNMSVSNTINTFCNIVFRRNHRSPADRNSFFYFIFICPQS